MPRPRSQRQTQIQKTKRMMIEQLTKEKFNEALLKAKTICLLGHISPDGDCIGSVLGAYNYIKNLPGGSEKIVQPYLEEINKKFYFLKGSDIISSARDGIKYDLAVVLDCADIGRIGKLGSYLEDAESSLLIDHHITNPGFCDMALVRGDASSASEVLYTLMDEQYVDKAVAECIYTGIVHDTGVFRHNSTHRSTMEIAGKCMDYGIDFGSIIEDSFFAMNFDQKVMLGYILNNMKSRFDGKLVYGWVDMAKRKELGAEKMDMDGMIDNMRSTTGALAAVYMYETLDGRVKASLRSNSDIIDVSVIAQKYGGGGHKRAAGCFVSKDFEKNIEEIAAEFGKQLKAAI